MKASFVASPTREAARPTREFTMPGSHRLAGGSKSKGPAGRKEGLFPNLPHDRRGDSRRLV